MINKIKHTQNQSRQTQKEEKRIWNRERICLQCRYEIWFDWKIKFGIGIDVLSISKSTWSLGHAHNVSATPTHLCSTHTARNAFPLIRLPSIGWWNTKISYRQCPTYLTEHATHAASRLKAFCVAFCFGFVDWLSCLFSLCRSICGVCMCSNPMISLYFTFWAAIGILFSRICFTSVVNIFPSNGEANKQIATEEYATLQMKIYINISHFIRCKYDILFFFVSVFLLLFLHSHFPL